MADVKITALTAISANPVNPATFPMPMVDLLDTSMAASGTTKKVTVNQILGAGGTATLASATITGAATVGTTLGVTGVSTFAAGTALLPALTTTGDTNTGIYYPAADTFAVTTGGTERYRVDSSGNVGIGVTPTTSRLLLQGNGTNIPVKIVGTTGDTTIPHLVIDKKDNNTTTSQLFIQFVVADNGAGSGQINANGVNQAAFGTYSDSRLKKNIVSLPSQLANILSLRPVEFDYKDGNGHQIGFIAQEMQEVYADAVGEQEGFLTVSGWNKTEARLVSAIKELAAKVQALEAKLA